MSDAPKIQIDSDWKAEAQAEKQRLAEQAKSKAASASSSSPSGASTASASGARAAQRELPEANFETLVSTTATQALFSMGAIADPRTGQPNVQLDLARHHIDMLTVLEEKTQGNLSDEENKMLATTLYELRGRFVQVANAARQKQ